MNTNSNKYNQKILESAAEQWVQLLTLQLQSSKRPASKNLELSVSEIKNKYSYEIAKK